MPLHFTDWRKSQHSQPEEHCVEAGRSQRSTVGIRDTKAKDDSGPVLELARPTWAALLAGLRAER